MGTSSVASRRDLEMIRVMCWLIIKALIKNSSTSEVEVSHSDSSKLLKFYQKKKDQTEGWDMHLSFSMTA